MKNSMHLVRTSALRIMMGRCTTKPFSGEVDFRFAVNSTSSDIGRHDSDQKDGTTRSRPSQHLQVVVVDPRDQSSVKAMMLLPRLEST
jgi:hypothetical protein